MTRKQDLYVRALNYLADRCNEPSSVNALVATIVAVTVPGVPAAVQVAVIAGSIFAFLRKG